MPCILAIDTSTDACSVALLTPNIQDQQISVTPREHTQRLLPMVQAILSKHSVSLSMLDAIAIGIGPGSFTGLRIGLSVAQGLAYGADLPLIPVSTLQAMSQTALRTQVVMPSNTIVSVIDARMDEVYWSAYQYQKASGQVEPLCEEFIAAPEELVKNEIFTDYDNVYGIGSGWHYNILQGLPVSCTQSVYPEAMDIALLGQSLYKQGKALDPLNVSPVYLREEVSWKKRQRIRSV